MRDIGLVVYSGMVGFPFSLVSMEPPLGLRHAADSAGYLVESALGRFSSGLLAEWGPPFEFDAVEAVSLFPDHPNVWTDGSLVLDRVTGVSSAGPGFFAHQPASCWDHRCWVMVIRFAGLVMFSVAGDFLLFLGLSSLFSVLSYGVLFLLYSPLVLSILVLVIWVLFAMFGGLLDGRGCSVPFELVKDGDLLVLIERMLHLRGLDNVRISKVKGHADEGMVLQGRVREVDRIGDNAADEAADFGRRRFGHLVIDARRNLSGVCGRWYPVVLDLHRFFIATARAVVNHDDRGGVAPDPLVWSAGARPKRRRPVCAVRDRAFLPGPPGIWDYGWVTVPPSVICADDIAHWPYTLGILG